MLGKQKFKERMMLAAALLIAGLLLMSAAFWGKAGKTAQAAVPAADVGELYIGNEDSDGNVFDKDALLNLYKAIGGESVTNLSDLNTLATDTRIIHKTKFTDSTAWRGLFDDQEGVPPSGHIIPGSTEIASVDPVNGDAIATNNKYQNVRTYFTMDDKNHGTGSRDFSSKNYLVHLGGRAWYPVFLTTKDNATSVGRDTHIILTLWLAETEETIRWASGNSVSYADSAIREFLKGPTYEAFTKDSGNSNDLSDYLVTPGAVKYQENENLVDTTNQVDTPSKTYTNENHTGWESDLLWIPSYNEAGIRTRYNYTASATTSWALTNYNGYAAKYEGDLYPNTIWADTQSQASAGFGLSGDEFTWLRTSEANGTVHVLTPEGFFSNQAVSGTGYVRPALHLDLTKADAASATVVDAGVLAEGQDGVKWNADELVYEKFFDGNPGAIRINAAANLPFEVSGSKSDGTTYGGNVFSTGTNVDAGEYHIDLRLKKGYIWRDGSSSSEDYGLTLRIRPRKIGVFVGGSGMYGSSSFAPSVSFFDADGSYSEGTLWNNMQILRYLAPDGIPQYSFSWETQTGEAVTPDYTTAQGTYEVEMTLTGQAAENFEFVTGSHSGQFIITPAYLGKPEFSPSVYNATAQGPMFGALPDVLTQNGTYSTWDEVATVEYYNKGTESWESTPSARDVGEYQFRITLNGDHSSNYQWAEGAEETNPQSATFTYQITKATLTAPAGQQFIYNGDEQRPDFAAMSALADGLCESDGVTGANWSDIATASYVGEGWTDARSDPYTVTLTLKDEIFKNYMFPDGTNSATVSYQIVARKITASLSGEDVFDSTNHDATVTFTDATGADQGEWMGVPLSEFLKDELTVKYFRQKDGGGYEDIFGSPLHAGTYVGRVALTGEHANNFIIETEGSYDGGEYTITTGENEWTTEYAREGWERLHEDASPVTYPVSKWGTDRLTIEYFTDAAYKELYPKTFGWQTEEGIYYVKVTIPAEETYGDYDELVGEYSFTVAPATNHVYKENEYIYRAQDGQDGHIQRCELCNAPTEWTPCEPADVWTSTDYRHYHACKDCDHIIKSTEEDHHWVVDTEEYPGTISGEDRPNTADAAAQPGWDWVWNPSLGTFDVTVHLKCDDRYCGHRSPVMVRTARAIYTTDATGCSAQWSKGVYSVSIELTYTNTEGDSIKLTTLEGSLTVNNEGEEYLYHNWTVDASVTGDGYLNGWKWGKDSVTVLLTCANILSGGKPANERLEVTIPFGTNETEVFYGMEEFPETCVSEGYTVYTVWFTPKYLAEKFGTDAVHPTANDHFLGSEPYNGTERLLVTHEFSEDRKPATGHSFVVNTDVDGDGWVWYKPTDTSDNNWHARLTFRCAHCEQAVAIETDHGGSVTQNADTTEPTCTQVGVNLWDATVTVPAETTDKYYWNDGDLESGDYKTTFSTKTPYDSDDGAPALKHQYEVSFVWDESGEEWTVTSVTLTCTRDCCMVGVEGHTITLTGDDLKTEGDSQNVRVVHGITESATCDTKGLDQYSASLTDSYLASLGEKGETAYETLSYSETATTSKTIPALGHSWVVNVNKGDIGRGWEWEWEDGKPTTITLHLYCSVCREAGKETSFELKFGEGAPEGLKDITFTSVVTKTASCAEVSQTTYTIDISSAEYKEICGKYITSRMKDVSQNYSGISDAEYISTRTINGISDYLGHKWVADSSYDGDGWLWSATTGTNEWTSELHLICDTCRATQVISVDPGTPETTPATCEDAERFTYTGTAHRPEVTGANDGFTDNDTFKVYGEGGYDSLADLFTDGTATNVHIAEGQSALGHVWKVNTNYKEDGFEDGLLWQEDGSSVTVAMMCTRAGCAHHPDSGSYNGKLVKVKLTATKTKDEAATCLRGAHTVYSATLTLEEVESAHKAVVGGSDGPAPIADIDTLVDDGNSIVESLSFTHEIEKEGSVPTGHVWKVDTEIDGDGWTWASSSTTSDGWTATLNLICETCETAHTVTVEYGGASAGTYGGAAYGSITLETTLATCETVSTATYTATVTLRAGIDDVITSYDRFRGEGDASLKTEITYENVNKITGGSVLGHHWTLDLTKGDNGTGWKWETKTGDDKKISEVDITVFIRCTHENCNEKWSYTIKLSSEEIETFRQHTYAASGTYIPATHTEKAQIIIEATFTKELLETLLTATETEGGGYEQGGKTYIESPEQFAADRLEELFGAQTEISDTRTFSEGDRIAHTWVIDGTYNETYHKYVMSGDTVTEEVTVFGWTWNGTDTATLHVTCEGCKETHEFVFRQEGIQSSPRSCIKPGYNIYSADMDSCDEFTEFVENCGLGDGVEDDVDKLVGLAQGTHYGAGAGPMGHNWSAGAWTWNYAADGWTATLTVSCSNSGCGASHTITVKESGASTESAYTCTMSVVHTPETCETGGSNFFTATVNYSQLLAYLGDIDKNYFEIYQENFGGALVKNNAGSLPESAFTSTYTDAELGHGSGENEIKQATGHTWIVNTAINSNGWSWDVGGSEADYMAYLTLKCSTCSSSATVSGKAEKSSFPGSCTEESGNTYKADLRGAFNEFNEEHVSDDCTALGVPSEGADFAVGENYVKGSDPAGHTWMADESFPATEGNVKLGAMEWIKTDGGYTVSLHLRCTACGESHTVTVNAEQTAGSKAVTCSEDGYDSIWQATFEKESCHSTEDKTNHSGEPVSVEDNFTAVIGLSGTYTDGAKPYTGHKWVIDNAVAAHGWLWTPDGDSYRVTVQFKCETCEAVHSVNAEVGEPTVKPATCVAAGSRTFVATLKITSSTARLTDRDTFNQRIPGKEEHIVPIPDFETYPAYAPTQQYIVTLPALGHIWEADASKGTSGWDWAEDGSSATLHLVCSDCKATSDIKCGAGEIGFLEETARTDASCETAGSISYRATAHAADFRGELGVTDKAFTSDHTVTLSALGHSWTVDTETLEAGYVDGWKWTSDGGWTADPYIICQTCGNHLGADSYTVKVTLGEQILPTCTTAGTDPYTATATVTDTKFTFTSTKEVAVDPTGHSWQEAFDVVWSPDYHMVTVTFTCSACTTTHVETAQLADTAPESGNYISVEKTAATCVGDGLNVYTAHISFAEYKDGAELEDEGLTKEETVPTVGAHDWTIASAGWVWTPAEESGAAAYDVTLTLTCSACGKEITVKKGTQTFDTGYEVTATLTVEYSFTPATCTADSAEQWAATVTLTNGSAELTFTDTKSGTPEPYFGHKWIADTTYDGDGWLWSAVTGSADWTCGLHLKCETCGETRIVPVETSLKTTPVTCDKDEVLTYTGKAAKPVPTDEGYYTDRDDFGTLFGDDGTAQNTHELTGAPMKGHSWKADISYSEEGAWTWNSKTNTATLHLICSVCKAKHSIECTATSSGQAATCTEEGGTVYMATLTTESYKGLTEYDNFFALTAEDRTFVRFEKTDDKLPHRYVIAWSWTENMGGGYSAAATRTCEDCGDSSTAAAEVTSRTVEPTCLDDGNTTYTATVTFDDGTMSETATAQKVVPIAAAGHHDYGEKTDGKYAVQWVWTENNSSATAVFTCIQCGQVVSVTAEKVAVSGSPATCEQDSTLTYTATVTFGNDRLTGDAEAEYTDVRRDTTPAHGHNRAIDVDYAKDGFVGGWKWTPQGDGFKVEAAIKCLYEEDAPTVVMEVKDVTSVPTDATCTSSAFTVFTATFTIDGAVFTDSKTVEGAPALGHSYKEPDASAWKWVSDGSSVSVTVECDRCDHTISVTLTHTPNEYGVITARPDETHPATCEGMGTTVYLAAVAVGDSSFTSSLSVLDIPATGHNYVLDTSVADEGWEWKREGETGAYYAVAHFRCTNPDCEARSTTEDAHQTAAAVMLFDVAEHENVVTYDETAATCTFAADVTYHAEVWIGDIKYTNTHVVRGEALGHLWGAWEMSGERAAHTHARHCVREIADDDGSGTHVCNAIDAEAPAVSWTEEIVKPTCVSAGFTRHTCEVCGYFYDDGETDPSGHTFGGPVWSEWEASGGGYLVTATFTCSVCGHIETRTAAIGASEVAAATCEKAGTTEYTATVEFGSKTYTATMRADDIPATGHRYGDPVWTFEKQGDTFAVTAVFPCENECGKVETVIAEAITSAVESNATCEEDGVMLWFATVHFLSAEYTGTHRETIPALNGGRHDLRVEHFTDADGTHMHRKVCAVCGEQSGDAEPCTDDSPVVVPATCEEVGYTQYTCGVCGYVRRENYTSSSHDYTISEAYEAGWEWTEADDVMKAFVHLVCTRCEDELTVAAEVKRTETAATCTEDGEIVFRATAVFNGIYSAEKMLPGDPATGHTFGEAVWNRTGSERATATFECSVCGHLVQKEGKIASRVTPPSCEENGYTTYTASVEFDDRTHTHVRKGTEVPASGHSYSLPGEDDCFWGADGKSLRVELTCAICGEGLTVRLTTTPNEHGSITGALLSAPTCVKRGTTRYTAVFSAGKQTFRMSIDVADLAATGHSYGAPVWSWNDGYTAATARFICGVCGETHEARGGISASEVLPTCEEDGYTIYTARVSFGEYAGGAEQQNIVHAAHSGSALGHAYGAPFFTWEEDLSLAVATYSCARCGRQHTAEASVETKEEDKNTVFTATSSFGGVSYSEKKLRPHEIKLEIGVIAAVMAAQIVLIGAIVVAVIVKRKKSKEN